tara:strand:- start:161 stop:382 length:222 start_codon:yes stop_codon:yes gene_type:complete
MGGIVENFLSNDKGKIIISIIWGLGLAAMFRKVCKGRNCIIIKGPKPAELENKVFRFENKCYIYNAMITKCNK